MPRKSQNAEWIIKALRFMVSAWLLLAAPLAHAQFAYATNGIVITLTAYSGGYGSVVVSNFVTSIGSNAFANSDVTDVTLPDSVTDIGSGAFSQCDFLVAITMPDSVSNLGVGAFGDCENLRSVTIPANVGDIRSNIFFGCSSLYSVTIPASVTSIEKFAFGNCDALFDVYFEGNPPSADSTAFAQINEFQQIDGLDPSTAYYLPYMSGWGPSFDSLPTADQFEVMTNSGTLTITNFNGPGEDLIVPASIAGLPVVSIGAGAFAQATAITSVTISNGVNNIGANAFAGQTMTSLAISDSVTNIGTNAFFACRLLTNASLGNGVAVIGANAFADCYTLAALTIPDSVTDIGSNAFGDCFALANVSLGSNITEIGATAFTQCPLATVVMPDRVASIGDEAFEGCTNLAGVTLSNGVTNLGVAPFAGCTNMAAISVTPGNSVYSSLNGVLFDKNQITLLEYPGNGGGSYVIPNGVTAIASHAFYGTDLTGLSIADSVTAIGDAAFEGVDLRSVTIPNGVGSIGPYAFAYTPLGSVTIPNSVTNIGDDAFTDSGLGSVAIGSGVVSMGEYAFGDCHELGAVTFSNGLTSIGQYAFADCLGLRTLIIPASVTNLGEYAFENCTNMISMYFEGNAFAADSSVFAYTDDLGNVLGSYVVTLYYLLGTEGWSDPFAGETAVMLPTSYFTGSLRVTITPTGAVNAGARWRVDDGSNLVSGVTVGDLSAGNHIVSFTSVSGYIAPASESVMVAFNTTTTGNGSYLVLDQDATVFPIATNGVASQAGLFAAFGGGNYLAAIQGDGSTNNSAISAQLFSRNGVLTGSRLLTGRKGGIPYVAFGGSNFVMVWSDNAPVAGGGNDQVYGQFVNQTGAPVGGAFTFGPTNEEQDMQGGGGSLLAFDGSNFLAVWDTGGFHDSPGGDIHGALFNQTGSLAVPVIAMTSEGTGALTPTVAFGKTNYLIVWNNRRATGPELYDICGEFISTSGVPGSTFIISQTPTPSYDTGCIGFDGTNFMVVWPRNLGSASPNTLWHLYGRRVSPNGTFLGAETALVTDANNPEIPSLAFDGANYLMAWNVGAESAASQMIFQFFDTAGVAVGGEFSVFPLQGTNTPVAGGVLFDGSRFEVTGILGGTSTVGSQGTDFTSGTGTWGAFLSTASPSGGGSPAGSLQVTITPAGAVSAGAQWQLDNGAWQESGAIVTNISPGSHLVAFEPVEGWAPPPDQFATISNGEISAINAVYTPAVLPADGLTLVTNGFGTITHAAWPEELLALKKYTVKAAAKAGNVFVNWVGGTAPPYPVLSASPSYTFSMQSNLLLEANFVTNIFVAAHGSYYGLFAPAAGDRQQNDSGSFNFNLTSQGAVSGKLILGSETVALTGKFNPDGSAQLTSAPKGGSGMTTRLQLDLPNQAVNGTVSNASFTVPLTGGQSAIGSRSTVAKYAGKYTMVIAGTTDPATGPAGASYGTVTIGSSGQITLAGSLADGTSVSQSSAVLQDGSWPLYVNLYGGKGSLWGWNYFTNGSLATNFTVSWINGGDSSKTAALTSGFTNQAAVLAGSPYNPNANTVLGFSSGDVLLAGGSLAAALSNGVDISAKNIISLTNASVETNKLKLTVNKSSGVITGSFSNPGNSKQTIKVNGVILQNQAVAQGYFLENNESGTLLIDSP